MNSGSLLSLLTLMLLVAPVPCRATVPDDDSVVAEDGAGDVRAAGVPTDAFPALDLTGLAVEENETHLQLFFSVPLLETANTPFRDTGVYQLFFDYGDASFRVIVNRSLVIDGRIVYSAVLQHFDRGAQHFQDVETLQAGASEPQDLIWVAIPFARIVSNSGLPAAAGQFVDGLWMWAGNSERPSDDGLTPPTVVDRIPNEGATRWQLRKGNSGQGPFLLSLPDASRLANGGEVLFQFPVDLANARNEETTIEFRVTAPPGWNSFLVDSVASIPPSGLFRNTLIIQGNASHQHGTVLEFVVHATAVETGDEQEARAIVAFAEPAQPAGHHDVVFWHSHWDPFFPLVPPEVYSLYDPRAVPYMNTLAEDPNDAGLPTAAEFTGGNSSFRQWVVPLEPELALGLDLDLGRRGETRLVLQSEREAPLKDVNLSGSFVISRPGQETTVATFTAALDQLAGRTTATVPILPTLEGDFVAQAPNQQLLLRMAATISEPAEGTTPFNVEILPGTFFRLPLNEYAETVAPIPAAGVTLEVPRQIPIRPGSKLVFEVQVVNQAPAVNRVELEFLGLREGWIGKPLGEPIRLEVGESGTARLELLAPEDALDGDQVRMLLAARDSWGGPTAVAGIAILVDSTAPVQEENSSRGAPTLALAAPLALAIALAGRRRLP